jgi:hypothetical protein
MERFADRIVRHLARQGYQPQKVRKLARAMRIADEEYGDFREVVKALMKTGRAAFDPTRAASASSFPTHLTPVVTCSSRPVTRGMPSPAIWWLRGC